MTRTPARPECIVSVWLSEGRWSSANLGLAALQAVSDGWDFLGALKVAGPVWGGCWPKGFALLGHSKPDCQEIGEQNCPSTRVSLAVPTPRADLQAFTSGLSTRS